MNNKKIRSIFITRASLWLVATVATIYWIVWSFKIYADLGEPETGLVDVHTYASILRPKLYGGLIIAITALIISTVLRKISDKIKQQNRELPIDDNSNS